MMARYRVHPIADANCDAANQRVTIVATDHLATAKWHASHNSCVYGACIWDSQTGQLDVGFGFGVPCPDLPKG
jgi:hypothetical protein